MLQNLDHSHRLSTKEGSGSGKINSLFNLISHQPDIAKMCLFDKDRYEASKVLIAN